MELLSSSILSQSERLIKINPLNSSSFNVDIIHEVFRDLVEKSINYPSSIQVVRQNDDFGHEYLETLDDALQQFFQYRPTDDQILQDPNYINNRKEKILRNLCEEVENVQIIIQSVGSLDYQETKDFQLKQGSKLSIHLKNIFDKDVVNANFGILLNSFLTSCYILLKDFISHIKGEVQQITFDQLADFQSENQQQSLFISDRNSRFAVKRLDETIDVNKQLEESRQELNRLEITVLKIAILLERINYYTMGGVIRLRDQNLNIIPFFESTEPQNYQYDLQSCLKISCVIRKQIECLEEIEIQEWNSINAQKKLKKSLPKIIRNYKTIQKQIADVAVADDIYKEIWSSFCEEETKKQLSDIKVYMQLKVTKFKTPTYKVTLKLYQKTAATSQYRECAITSMNDSWIFTELPFFDSLVKDELILVIYVFGLIDEVDIEKNQVYQNKSVQKLRFVKAVSLINLSDTFFEKGMKDGYQAELGKIRFDSFDKEWPVDSQFSELQKKIADQRRKAPDLDVAFNRSIQLEMQLAFFTSIHKNQFVLRQDQSQLVRQDRFWQYIVKPKTEHIPANDNQAIFNHEIERMNLQVLKQNKNEFRVKVNQLKITSGSYTTCLIRVYFVNDRMPLQSFMNQGSSKRDHYHQTQMMTLNKVPGLFNSQVQTSFASEFCIELPQANISNPVNYKLVFVVYMPQYCIKNNKVEKSKITEKMVTDQPSEYIFKPTLFAIQSVFSSFATINLEEVRVLTLFSFNKSEQSFEQQILNWATIKPADVGKLSIRIDVVSNQYSQSRLTESQKFIVSDNEIVTRFNRIVFNLLHNYGEGIGSKKTLKQLIQILDKLSQMAPFKSLLKDALKNFEPESESVLYCLQNQLKELDETISKVSNIFFTSSSSFDQVDYEKLLKKFQYLPLLLDCRCKSFSFYFELNYKQLAHQIQDFMVKIGINRQIVQVIKQESQKALIKNSEFNLQRFIRNLRNCLEILNDYLLENGDTIIFQELKQNQIMGNVGRNTVLFNSHFENDFVYERRQSKQDSITERISYEQSKQLTNYIEKVNLLELKYQEFSADAMKTILNITENLHQQLNLQDHSLCKQIFEIKDQKRIKNLSDQNQVDQFESLLEKFKHDLKKYLLSGQHFSLQNQVASFESARTSSQITAMFNNYNQYRKKLRLLFYKKINKTLQAVRYFIDCDFLKKIFDTLLRPIENNLDQIIKNCLPLYKLDKENLPEEINKTIQEECGTIQISDFKLLFDQSLKDLKVKQQTDIDIQAIAKIKMICKILTLDVIFSVPAQYNEANFFTSEYIAQKCSQSVYLLMKQYKSSFSLENLNIKDRTTSEWFYLFLYQMSEFDKKLANNVVCIAPTQSEVHPAPDKFAQSNRKSTDQQMINIIDDNPQIIEEKKSVDDQGSSSQYNLSGYGLEETRESGSIIIKESDASYIELARLKSSKQILLSKADSTAIERRFCWFFNDLEDAFLKHQILKDPHQKLANKYLVDLKSKYNSLLSVISVHHLSKMTSQSLRVLYVDRPGSLDRLIKQVANMVTNYQFHQYELYFNIKKLHVADAFSKELINMLCDIKNQIAGQLVKNTFKSILSQVWLLQYKLFALNATAYYEFKYTGQYAPNEQYAFDLQQFEKKLKSHAQTQLFLYDSFKDMGDIILPNESEPQREIQTLLFSIVKKDLENMKITNIDQKMLETLMRQLAQMYVQIDFLTFKSKSILSQQAFEQIEFLFITVFEQDLNSNQKNSQNHQTLINKKEQIYNAFCDQYFEIIKQQIQNGQDTVFGQQLNKRAYEVNLIKDLYMQVIQYERLVNNQQEIYQKGHIISQLIAFSTLMIKLQENNLTFSFKNMMNGKYKTMIDNIDSILNEHFYKQKKDAKDKNDIFMKHESQFLNQMREVKAFMQYEDFKTFMTAIDLGYLNSQSKAIKKMYEEIYNVVDALLPKSEECQDWVNENQFFDKALQLLNEDVKKSYRKEAVRQTLAKQIECLQLYKSFQRRNLYCKYWRVDIEKYLPESARVEDRILIYRSSPNHDPSFITDDIQVLLGLEKSDQLDIKILQILTNKEREIFQILQNTKGLSNTCDENFKNCPENFKTFYQCNYKSQFFTIEQINTDSKNFDEQYQITIYEVMKSFPTFTPFQKVEMKFIKRIPVVQYTLKKELEEYLTEIQDLIEKSNQDQYSDEQNQNKNTEQFIGQAINKYLINDGVAGGLGVQIQKYFNKGLAKGFVDLDSNLKHAYLELYKGFESVFVELDKLLDVYKKMAQGEAQIYKKGKDGLSERREILKKAYKDSELKEYEDGKL